MKTQSDIEQILNKLEAAGEQDTAQELFKLTQKMAHDMGSPLGTITMETNYLKRAIQDIHHAADANDLDQLREQLVEVLPAVENIELAQKAAIQILNAFRGSKEMPKIV